MKIKELEKIITSFEDGDEKTELLEKLDILQHKENVLVDIDLVEIHNILSMNNYLNAMLFIHLYKIFYLKILYMDVLDKYISNDSKFNRFDTTVFDKDKDLQLKFVIAITKLSTVQFPLIGCITDVDMCDKLESLCLLLRDQTKNDKDTVLKIITLCEFMIGYTILDQVLKDKNSICMYTTTCLKFLQNSDIDIINLSIEKQYLLSLKLWKTYKNFINHYNQQIKELNEEEEDEEEDGN